MKKRLTTYIILVFIIVILIVIDMYSYRDYKKAQKLNKKDSIEGQLKPEKSDEIKRKYGYSDILNFSSSNEGMKIMSIEKIDAQRQNIKVNFQYVGNNRSFEVMLDKLQKQENIIGVSNIKIKHNKDNDSNLGNINAIFTINK